MSILFRTSETDDKTIYRDDAGNYFMKRYGLPLEAISKEYANNQGWFECNRRGYFVHLKRYNEGETIPHLINPEAQQNIVNRLMGIKTTTLKQVTA